MVQVTAPLIFNKITEESTPVTLQTELRSSISVAPTLTSSQDFYISFDPTVIAKVYTVSIAVGTVAAGDDIESLITIGAVTRGYTYRVQAADTAQVIKDAIRNLIDSDPAVTASYTGDVFTVKSAIPGQDFALDVVETGTTFTVGTPVIVTPNAGTPNHGKVATADVTFSFDSQGFVAVGQTIKWYNGAQPTPVLVSTLPGVDQRHPTSLAALQAARGVV